MKRVQYNGIGVWEIISRNKCKVPNEIERYLLQWSNDELISLARSKNKPTPSYIFQDNYFQSNKTACYSSNHFSHILFEQWPRVKRTFSPWNMCLNIIHVSTNNVALTTRIIDEKQEMAARDCSSKGFYTFNKFWTRSFHFHVRHRFAAKCIEYAVDIDIGSSKNLQQMRKPERHQWCSLRHVSKSFELDKVHEPRSLKSTTIWQQSGNF